MDVVLKRILGLVAIATFGACASVSNPCTVGGDVSWTSSRFPDGRIRGDRHCKQKRTADGKYLNHGAYRVTYPSGALALEGRFEEGRKEGVWSEYDESGRKVAERYYENGVEKVAPVGVK